MLVTLHGYDINIYTEWWESGKGGPRKKKYPRQLLQLAREPRVHFLAVSRAIKNRAIEYGIPKHKITVSYIGVDSHRFRPSGIPIASRRKRILFVGRLVEKKGASYLIEAFAKLTSDVSDAELVIVGSGPEEMHLKHLARTLNISPIFMGPLTSDEVREQMLQARLFCLPSITAANGDAEGLPIVILEALASGLPVITSANGAVGEIVHHGYNGLCFPERDVERLRTHLRDLLLSESLIDIGNNARRSVEENMTKAICGKQLETIYDAHAGLNREIG